MFLSPWQTLYNEVDSNFIKYEYGENIIFFKKNYLHGQLCVSSIGVPFIMIDKKILERLCRNLKEKGVIAINSIIPNYYNQENVLNEKNGFDIEYVWGTYLLDLTLSSDEIKKGMSKSLKRNINKLQKGNYCVKEIKINALVIDDFVDIYNQSRKRANLPMNNQLKYDLKKLVGSESRKYFVLYIDSVPVACQGICYNNDVAIEVVLAISDYAHENKIYAGDLLKWEIIEWCKKKNIKIYDFAGVAPKPINEKEVGIKTYKAKWGGKYIEYNVYSKSLSTIFTFYRLLKKVLKK